MIFELWTALGGSDGLRMMAQGSCITPGCPGEFPDVLSLVSRPGNEFLSQNSMQNPENPRKSQKFLENLRKRQKFDKNHNFSEIFKEFHGFPGFFEICIRFRLRKSFPGRETDENISGNSPGPGDDAGTLRCHAEPARAAQCRPELENRGLGAHIPQDPHF